MGLPVLAPVGGRAFTASSSSTGSINWYSNAICTVAAAAGTFTIPAGSSTASVFYVDPRAGTLAISLANSEGLANPAPQSQTVVAGPPTVLAFTSGPRTQDALTCSPVASTIQTRDAFGNPSNVASNLAVGLVGSPNGLNSRISTTAACTPSVASVQVTTGTNQALFHFLAENPGALTISASAIAYANVTQVHTINSAQPTRLILAGPSSPAEAGLCSIARVSREDAINRPATPTSSTAVALAAMPSSGLRFFSDAACTVAVASISIASGTSFSDFYVKGITGGTSALTLSSPALTNATSNVVILPMVRRGTCTIAAGFDAVTCPVSPAIPGNDISRTFVVFAGSSAASTPLDASVRCRLNNGGVGVDVVCTRAGSGGAAQVSWQTVSFANTFANGGATVQHFVGNYNISVAAPFVQPITSVDPSKTFVLFSTQAFGSTTGADDFLTVSLTSPTTVVLSQSSGSTFSGTGAWALQVVSIAGSTVVRGTATAGPVATVIVSNLAAANVARTFPIFTARLGPLNDSEDICKRVLRGVVTDATTLTFTRGNGATGACTDTLVEDLAWERIELPVGGEVQSARVNHAANTDTGSTTIGVAVDLTRTVLLMASQGLGGQAGGESDFAGLGNDVSGAVLGTPSLSGTTVTVTRPAINLGSASFTTYVVQFAP